MVFNGTWCGVGPYHTLSIASRHLPPKEGCRKPVLGVWVRACVFSSVAAASCVHFYMAFRPLKRKKKEEKKEESVTSNKYKYKPT